MCESANQDNFTEQLSRAGSSIQAAVRQWNAAANWKWLGTTKDDYTTVVGTDTYSLPALCKNVHSVRMTGSIPRALEYVGRRQLNKMLPRQDQQNVPYFYDLFRNESTGGSLRLIAIPSIAETFAVDYYRQMVVPCTLSYTAGTHATSTTSLTLTSTAGVTVGSPIAFTDSDGPAVLTGTVMNVNSSTNLTISVGTDGTLSGSNVTGTIGGDDVFLDIPADYEDGILASATHHYLANRQGGGPKVQYWAAYAAEQLQKALANNQSDTPDQEIVFLPSYLQDMVNLSPNDIRWADMGW